MFSLSFSLFREPIPCSLFTACQLLAGRFLHTQLRNMRPNQVAQCLCHLEIKFAAVGAAGFTPQFSTQLQSWRRQLPRWSFLVIALLHFLIVKYKNNYKYIFFSFFHLLLLQPFYGSNIQQNNWLTSYSSQAFLLIYSIISVMTIYPFFD